MWQQPWPISQAWKAQNLSSSSVLRSGVLEWIPSWCSHRANTWCKMSYIALFTFLLLFSLGCVKFKTLFCVWHPLCLCLVQMFSLFLEPRQRRNALCAFNSSQALLSRPDLFILCLWSLLLKADPSDVDAWALAHRQREASCTGLNCDSQTGIGLPKGIFRLAPLCFHTKSRLFKTWSFSFMFIKQTHCFRWTATWQQSALLTKYAH